MSPIKPISPDDIMITLAKQIPDCLIQSINKLLLEKTIQANTFTVKISQAEIWNQLKEYTDTQAIEQSCASYKPSYATLFQRLSKNSIGRALTVYRVAGWTIDVREYSPQKSVFNEGDEYYFSRTSYRNPQQNARAPRKRSM